MNEENLNLVKKEFFKIHEHAEELGRTKLQKLAIRKARETLLELFWRRSLKRYVKAKPDSDAALVIEQVKNDVVNATRRFSDLGKRYSPKQGAPERSLNFEEARDACAFAATLHGQGRSLKGALLDAADKFKKNGKSPSLRTMYRIWRNRRQYFLPPEVDVRNS